MCMWFGYNPQIFFVTFFLVIFSGVVTIKAKRYVVGILCAQLLQFFFLSNIFKLHRWFGYSLKICMWFEYNPQIFFLHSHISGVTAIKVVVVVLGFYAPPTAKVRSK